MKTRLLLFYFSFSLLCSAQPGEKIPLSFYGIEIERLVNDNDSTIPVVPPNNLLFKNRFSEENELKSEAAILRIFNLEDDSKFSKIRNEIYWRNDAFNQCSWSIFYSHDAVMDNQRVQIIHEEDTMIIDFKNFIAFSQVNRDHIKNRIKMEKIVFQKGYFVYTIGKSSFYSTLNNNFQQLKDITSTDKSSYLKYYQRINYPWQNENYLTGLFFFMKGKTLIESHQFEYVYKQDSINRVMLDSAIIALNKSVQLDSAHNIIAKYSLLSKAFFLVQDYENSIEAISKAIHLIETSKKVNPESISSKIEERIAIYSFIGEHDKVMDDFNLLLKYTPYQSSAKIDKIHYLIKIEEYDLALSDVNALLEEYPSWNTKKYYGRTIGLVYYLKNEKAKAYREWLISLKLNLWNDNANNRPWGVWPNWPTLHADLVDSILHTSVDKTEELILCRTYYSFIQKKYSEPLPDSLLFNNDSLITDLDFLINRGVQNTDIFYLKSRIIEISNPMEALEMINKAIKYEPNNPFYYLLRYHIHSRLGLTFIDRNTKEKDLEKYRKLWKKFEYNISQ